jgi:hypothetical protein
MGIEDSYRQMLDQLAKQSALPDHMTLTELTRTALVEDARARRSLAEIFAQQDLIAVRESQRWTLGATAFLEAELKHSNELAVAAAALETHWPDTSALTMAVQAARWEAGIQEALKVQADLFKQVEIKRAALEHEEASLKRSILLAAAHWERQLLDSRSLMSGVIANWDLGSRESFQRLGEIENFAIAVPKLAAEVWPTDVVLDRIGLVEHSFGNVSALECLRGAAGSSEPIEASRESLFVAGEFVFGHGDLLARLPPSLPVGRQEESAPSILPHRGEEIGAKLEPLLRAVDPRLCELRRQAWQQLSKGVAGARMAMLGLREVYSELLRRFAPDDELVKSDVWNNRPSNQPQRPTRRERMTFIMGANASMLYASLQFDESIKSANKFSHTFAESAESVRVQMAQLDNLIYMILLNALERN